MNIFVTDTNTVKAARSLDDKRMVKMILESCQMLSTAINELGGTAPYKSTHKNHPSNVWTRQTSENWTWLWSYTYELCDVYRMVYDKEHKCREILFKLSDECNADNLLPKGELTPFVNCAANESKGISYKHIEDVVEAYRRYLVDRWNTDKIKPRWDRRLLTTDFSPEGMPDWAGLDNQGKLFYKGNSYEILFSPNNKLTYHGICTGRQSGKGLQHQSSLLSGNKK